MIKVQRVGIQGWEKAWSKHSKGDANPRAPFDTYLIDMVCVSRRLGIVPPKLVKVINIQQYMANFQVTSSLALLSSQPGVPFPDLYCTCSQSPSMIPTLSLIVPTPNSPKSHYSIPT